MFGKRKEDRKHRFADEVSDDLPAAESPPELGDDPELAAALLELGRNRHAPLPEPLSPETNEANEASEPADSSDQAQPAEPDEPGDSAESPEPEAPPVSFNAPGRPVVQTAAMLAEPEPETQPEPTSVGEVATYAALRRERSRAVEQEAALQKANDQVETLKAELKQLRRAAPATDAADVQAAKDRADELEQSLRDAQSRIEELTAEVERLRSADEGDELTAARERVASLTAELDRALGSSGTQDDQTRAALDRAQAADRTAADLQSTVATLKAELEQARSEAAAAGVALERLEREAKDQENAVATAEERADRLSAEIEQLRIAMAKGPAQVERLRRDAEREHTLRAALEQAQASQAKAEAALADNLRLASDLLSNLQSQEALITALTGLQTEVTEQRAWFEAQIANLGEGERQQAAVVDALEATVRERDVELESLREQLLEAETKRAEEAAAFVAALERP